MNDLENIKDEELIETIKKCIEKIDAMKKEANSLVDLVKRVKGE